MQKSHACIQTSFLFFQILKQKKQTNGERGLIPIFHFLNTSRIHHICCNTRYLLPR